MTPIQQMFLGQGAVSKTYVDDVFSTYLYRGNGGSQTITNGIDFSGKGGLLWFKNRPDSATQHILTDTVRGVDKVLYSDANNAETPTTINQSFNSNGWSMTNSYGDMNQNNKNYSSWSFRKQEGFFDVVTWTGNSDTNQTISHSLASVPGMIIAKRTDSSTYGDWVVYHRDHVGYLKLNSSNGAVNDSGAWTPVTSTSFKAYDYINVDGASYVAYIFAGGASTAATAASCSFNGTSGLNIAASSDINFGTGTFCVEGWVYIDQLPGGGYGRFFQLDGPSGNNDVKNLQVTLRPSDSTLHAWSYDGNVNVSISGSITMLQGWHHIAVVRDSNNLITQYVDGVADGTASNVTTDFSPNSGSPRPAIGHYPVDPTGGFTFDGKISNLRVTVGEPVYTANFKPIAEPLTTSNSQVTSSSNVKLLCCNSSSSATASTVTPGTISNNGTNPTAYGNNPFDDPAGFKFGENEDQNIIKCGSIHLPSGETNVGEYLGFEPQWYMYKQSDGSGDWNIFDSMRGWLVNKPGGGTYVVGEGLSPNTTGAEADYYQTTAPTSTGIHLDGVGSGGKDFIYMAIRRPDGYVGKPASVGTDVFAMDTGDGDSTIPNYDSGFPVDFALEKYFSGSQAWYGSSRLTSKRYFEPSDNTVEASGSTWYLFDSNLGWGSATGQDSTYQSWMFKRGQGFDVVGYTGNGTAGRGIPHSLSVTPEMMWVKNRNSAEDWFVYHSGLYDGYGPTDSPQNYRILLNQNSGVSDTSTAWNDTAPTATHFTVGNADNVNKNNETHIAMLFSSVTGISKVGTYTGNHAARTITTGFQPRFLIIKGQGTGNDNEWVVFDTTRGWASGVDNYLVLNSSAGQTNALDAGQPTSTGFTLTGGDAYRRWNDYGVRYIYYAHA